MAIGEYELAVLKAIHLAGGTINSENPAVEVNCKIDGDIGNAISKLCASEYLDRHADTFQLTELAWEYLELLGMH